MRTRFAIGVLLCAILTACRTDTVPASRPAGTTVAEVTLRFEDSAGIRVVNLRGDSLPPNLRDIVRALLRDGEIGSRFVEVEGDTARDNLWGLCGCPAPRDSIDIRMSDGSRMTYQIFCSGITKRIGDSLLHIEIPEMPVWHAIGRWDRVRFGFCPQGDECSDEAPEAWDDYAEFYEDSGWEWDYDDPCHGAWTRLVDATGSREPYVALQATLRATDDSIAVVTIDSVGDAYRAAAAAYAAGCVGATRFPPRSGRYRVTAVNFANEK